jgi:REP element-mobilizing transposase RayT
MTRSFRPSSPLSFARRRAIAANLPQYIWSYLCPRIPRDGYPQTRYGLFAYHPVIAILLCPCCFLIVMTLLLSISSFHYPSVMSAPDISVPDDFPYPRRYFSLDALGFDYAETATLHFATVNCNSLRPLFADITLAKKICSYLFNFYVRARIRVHVYTVLPDRLHLLAGVVQPGRTFANSLRAFRHYTSQLYWKRSRQVVRGRGPVGPGRRLAKARSNPHAQQILEALAEWRTTYRPEMAAITNWPTVLPVHFLGKHLWQHSLHDQAVIRTDADLREKVEYIAMDPVRRGYVERPEYYPFTGFNPCGDDTL